MARALKQVTATGDVVAGPVYLRSVVLTHTGAAGVLTVRDGSGGAVQLTMRCLADTTAQARFGGDGVYFTGSINVASITGTADFEIE
jgi:hypothetical protein